MEDHITANKIMKKSLNKHITDFMQTLNKLFGEKQKQINKNKQTRNIKESNSRKANISSLNNSDKTELLVFIPATKTFQPKVKDIDIAIISKNAYFIPCYLKIAQVFTILMRDKQYQTEKKVRVKTNLKSLIPQEYHNFLDVFLKKH